MSPDYLLAYAEGPVNVADLSEGHTARRWRVRADKNALWLARSNDTDDGWDDETIMDEVAASGSPPILELSLAFGADGRPVVACERATGSGGSSEIWVDRWTGIVGGYAPVNVGAGRTPRALFDLLPAPEGDGICPCSTDLHVFYVKAETGIVRRIQSEDFDTEHSTPADDSAERYLLDAFPVASERRISMSYGERNASTGRYALGRLDSAPYRETRLLRPNILAPDFSLPWYQGSLYEGGAASGSFGLTVLVVDSCDVIELQCANSFPDGPQPDTGGIWTEQVQESNPAFSPLDPGDTPAFSITVNHGGGTMQPCAFRVRARRTVGAETCYSPWRYYLAVNRVTSAPDITTTDLGGGCYERLQAAGSPFIEGAYLAGAGSIAFGPGADVIIPGVSGIGGCIYSWSVQTRNVVAVNFSDPHASYAVAIKSQTYAAAGEGAGAPLPDPNQTPRYFPASSSPVGDPDGFPGWDGLNVSSAAPPDVALPVVEGAHYRDGSSFAGESEPLPAVTRLLGEPTIAVTQGGFLLDAAFSRPGVYGVALLDAMSDESDDLDPLSPGHLEPFPFRFEWPMDEVLLFDTRILDAESGNEQRIAFGNPAIPRRGARAHVTAYERDASHYLLALLTGWAAKTFGVPLWWNATALAADIGSGATAFTVRDASHRELVEGRLVMLWSAHDRWEVRILATVTGDDLTITTPLLRDWTAGKTLVVPLRLGRLGNVVPVARDGARLTEMDVDFLLDPVP